MLNKTTLEDILRSSSMKEDEVSEVANKIEHLSIFPGKELYVVTQYLRHRPFEVVTCIVTKIGYSSHKNRVTYTLDGKYTSNGNYYNGNFTPNSLGTTLFLSLSEAQKVCEIKNKKRNS